MNYKNILNKLKAVKKRAKRKGLEFNLTKDWVEAKLQKGRCEATGLLFKLDKKPFVNPYYPTIDRINSDKGYTTTNCQIVCWMFNNAKAECDEETFAYWAKHFVKEYEKKHA